MSAASTAQCRRTSRFSRFLQRGSQALPLRLVELHCRSDLHVGDVLDFGAQLPRTSRRFRAAGRGGDSRASVRRKLRPCSSREPLAMPAMSSTRSAGCHARAGQQLRDALVGNGGRRGREHLRPACERACLARVLEGGLGVGSRDRDFLGHGSAAFSLARSRARASPAGRRAPSRRSHDRGACRRRRPRCMRHFVAQLLARAIRLRAPLSLAGLADQTLAFGDRGAARFVDQLVRAAVRLIDDLARLRTRFLDDVGRRSPSLPRGLFSPFSAEASPSAILLLPLVDGRDQTAAR